MGDMGNDFSNQQMEFFSGVDVLLAHAGGFPVISIEELERIIKAVRPKLVIPMHYCTPIYKPQDNLPIDNFLELFQSSDIDMIEASSTVLVRENLPENTRALVLQSA
jgi:L-ascorbate metabolism protein UlaG (beta-lactamase superfamily)